ncbi:MAG: nucleoside phosphorylase [Ruminococcus sp.]|uniref:nucleoside phosphorylase n=1 Tax=Ruminococcus sp. TaxID=41978 RepID=UPI0025D921A1|nr:nucleoside phosphorylase [Ruminococcus sp.]MBR5682760.1 nucleoside phosphorylase [Ruminococcus sp.]
MPFYKNDMPILEYDTSVTSLFGIKSELRNLKLPKKAVYALLGSCMDEYAAEHNAVITGVIPTITRDYPIYTVNCGGEEICLCQAPMGAPAAVQNMEILLACGVEQIISAGSCGVLTPMPENEFIVPVRALRDEGCSYKYLPPSRHIELDMPLTDHICTVLGSRSIPFRKCTTWTTDGLFRETPDTVAHRRSEGCDTVDMECASLAACAKFRGIDFGMLFFTADSLADLENYDRRDFGVASLEPALRLCMDIIVSYNAEN